MNIDQETLNKIAHLARLEFDENETQAMVSDMGKIISFVEKLNEVNTDGVDPLTTMSHEVNAFRDDIVKTDLPPEEVLKNAPAKDSSYFRVPKVLE
ncbi:MAG: aspartyl-tRNA(Asn)/glutamyl-tRNA(Gln) amidotransferase subunit C [Cytophagales bacterium]|jgi:aspartyl-tRNA(Asn)/glutamyl-tRNA(Gln) amidotransferase subunit C|nr:Asp-tRNA(Asn)/Glu-tRNA(Gln) amidotransferase subunit GatC [Bacteroidota bacterium]MBS1981445.1 Asp-tRNA(Asn)/Glu-tRNA(Gln) amidotransferase subunit GatC [Bacteroidota bacterium]WHZ06739.1 MAG: aspartyl-tRNA(Asn)/glutamyl-tRNA(Gln) amidotransferase subunit C [Cytophagales bacterium]